MTMSHSFLVTYTNAVLLLILTVLALGTVRWILSPALDAKRWLSGVDIPEEGTYCDPNQIIAGSALRLHFPSLFDATPQVSLSIIFPAYNEEKRIVSTLEITIAYLEKRKRRENDFTYEIIVVDDGSKDRTAEFVLEFVKKYTIHRVKLLKLSRNQGKGGAVRKGVMRSCGERILFADADNATRIEDLEKLERVMLDLHSLGHNGVIICGSRALADKDASAKRRLLRKILMCGFHFIVSTFCVKNWKDTQCGFKLFDRTSARLVFLPMHVERWGFDVELLYIAMLRKLVVKEISITWQEQPGSKVNVVTASLSMLREIVLIRLFYSLNIWTVQDGAHRALRKDS